MAAPGDEFGLRDVDWTRGKRRPEVQVGCHTHRMTDPHPVIGSSLRRPSSGGDWQAMRIFHLHRHHDVTGITGVGIVAEGVIFTDGSCAMRWLSELTSVVIFHTVEDILAIHGHQGHTELIYT